MSNLNSILLGVFILLLASCSQSINESNCKKINDTPKIFPDYNGATIPCNIAPLNFSIAEDGVNFQVKINSTTQKPIIVNSAKGIIDIPQNKWKKILLENKGSDIKIDVFIQDKTKKWSKYEPLVLHVSSDEIDSHLAYRIINVGYVLWEKLGLYQRDLTTFKETPIMLNRNTNGNCMNCHSFNKNNPETMMFHMRGEFGGTIIVKDGEIKKVDTKTPHTVAAGTYPSWHPDGKHIAFSVDMVYQWFHGVEKRNEVYDMASDLVIYNVETNTLTTSPKVSTKNRETLPCWSPDGKYIYYVSTQPLSDTITWDNVTYDLLRISYNTQTNQWGNVDTVLTAKELGGSISFPKISPNGKWLMFTKASHGYFTIYNSTSDLYLLNLETKKYAPFSFNSEDVDSYHSWSSNSKWIVFSSKRIDGLCTRPFFTHIDEYGVTSKPFVMPQKDPLFYRSFKDNYNVPELITGAVNVSKPNLLKVARNKANNVNFDTKVNVDGLSGATKDGEKAIH